MSQSVLVIGGSGAQGMPVVKGETHLSQNSPFSLAN